MLHPVSVLISVLTWVAVAVVMLVAVVNTAISPAAGDPEDVTVPVPGGSVVHAPVPPSMYLPEAAVPPPTLNAAVVGLVVSKVHAVGDPMRSDRDVCS